MGNEERASKRGYVAGPIRWWLLALGVVLTLTAVTYGFGASVSSATTEQVRAALDDAGLDYVAIASVDYRDVQLLGPAADEADAVDAASGVELVKSVSYDADESLAPAPTATPSPTPSESPSASPSPSVSASPSPSTSPSASETPVLPIPSIDSVHFDAFSAELTTATKKQLDGIADTILDVLESHPGLAVSLDGYSDSLGTEEDNDALTLERAQNVLDYLAQAGVPRDIMTATGHGEASPVASNGTEAGRALNRRVEITLTEG